MKKLTTVAALLMGMMAGANAQADTRIGVTVYKYDDNFMAVVRKAIEKEAAATPGVELLMNDSQNDQSKQNDQIDVLLAKGVKALAINLVDPAAAPVVIEKARGEDIPVVFYNKEPSATNLASYDKAYYVGTDSKESGIIQGQLIAKHWKAHPEWDLNKDGVIQFVLLKGEPGHPDAEARTSYVVKTLNDGGVKTEQLHMDTGMWDTAMAKDKMDAWISGPNANKNRSGHRQQRRYGNGCSRVTESPGQDCHSGIRRRCVAGSAGHGQERCHGGYRAERCGQPGQSHLRADQEPG